MMRLLPSYNADVAETAEKKLEQYRAGLSRLSYRDKVFSILRADFESGSGEYQSLVTLSEKLHVTPRTLQNHLKSQGASYQSVLDEVREQVSKKLLLTTDYKLEHISTLLAFSSASNFNRAFKKWTDKTAKEYRQEFK
jgi:AraC-like DNA-binding protein